MTSSFPNSFFILSFDTTSSEFELLTALLNKPQINKKIHGRYERILQHAVPSITHSVLFHVVELFHP
jgi:hypothetical protein